MCNQCLYFKPGEKTGFLAIVFVHSVDMGMYVFVHSVDMGMYVFVPQVINN